MTATAKQWTFSKMMLAGCTATNLFVAIKSLGMPGRLVADTRLWSDEDAKKIVALAKAK